MFRSIPFRSFHFIYVRCSSKVFRIWFRCCLMNCSSSHSNAYNICGHHKSKMCAAMPTFVFYLRNLFGVHLQLQSVRLHHFTPHHHHYLNCERRKFEENASDENDQFIFEHEKLLLWWRRDGKTRKLCNEPKVNGHRCTETNQPTKPTTHESWRHSHCSILMSRQNTRNRKPKLMETRYKYESIRV